MKCKYRHNIMSIRHAFLHNKMLNKHTAGVSIKDYSITQNYIMEKKGIIIGREKNHKMVTLSMQSSCLHHVEPIRKKNVQP